MGKVLEAPSVVTDLLGTMLEGRYMVHNLIAVGGMSVVFRGHHLRLKRDVAIKVLDPSIGPGSSTRFLREAESAAQLDHPNCITVHDFGVTSSGLSFMVMPLLVGDTLRARDPGRWDPIRAVHLVIEVLRGLDHAHGHGVIHRDLKPENIFLATEPDGTRVTKIVDFGLAKVIRGSEADSTTTMTGLMAGTPAYMSPEQALGLVVDERADLYSVGMTLYELLAGALPFDSEDGVALLRMQLHDQLPPLPDDVPAPLQAIIQQLTAKERGDRPASAKEALDAFEGFLRGDGHTVVSPPRPVRRATPEMVSASYPGVLADGATPTSDTAAMAVDATYPPHDMEPASRGSRWWLWLAAGVATASAATVVAMTLSSPVPAASVAPGAIADAPAADSSSTREEVGAISDTTKLLALVNDPEFGRREGYGKRHELLAALATTPAADKVDRRLQLGLDLVQAGQSPTPCRTFAEALGAIAKAGTAEYTESLREAAVPQPGKGEDPRACDGLAEQLDGLRGSPTAADEAPPAEPTEVAEAEPKKSRRHERAHASHTAPKPKRVERPVASRAIEPIVDPAPKAEPPKPTRKITKLDDDLRPPQ